MCLQCKSRAQCVLLRVLYSNIYGVVDVLRIVPNQEKVCEEATSFDLTSLDIAYCIADVDYLLQMKKEELVEGDGGMRYRRDHRSISSPPPKSFPVYSLTYLLFPTSPPPPLLLPSFPPPSLLPSSPPPSLLPSSPPPSLLPSSYLPSSFPPSLLPSSFPPPLLLPTLLLPSFPHLTTESTSDDDFKALLNLKGKMATWLCHIQHICVEAFNLRQKPILNRATLHCTTVSIMAVFCLIK